MSAQTTLFPEPESTVRRSADISDCGSYRYELTRRWGSGPAVTWVLLNPSTADARTDDATLRRVMSFARAWKRDAVVVRNLFALRSRNPADLATHADPVGPLNDQYLARCARDSLVVCGWGNVGMLHDRAMRVLRQLAAAGAPLHYLVLTSKRQPAHPLYLPGGLHPIPLTLHSAHPVIGPRTDD